MPGIKKIHPKEKSSLHPQNRHRERYNFGELVASCPELAPFVKVNSYRDESVDFFDPAAVMMLNKALLNHFYGIVHWNIPPGYLCPPVPGRADYIHHIADILGSCNYGRIPTGNTVRCLDIGVGANCIYPVIGNREYGWSFVGTDVDPVAIRSASEIVEMNGSLKGNAELRLQPEPNDIFRGIIQPDELFDLTICNPPFHASPEEAMAGTLLKLNNLSQKRITKPVLNFGGRNSELWCPGGEERFLRNMIFQSRQVASSCLWFSTLVSKQSRLKAAISTLEKLEAVEIKVVPMSQGNKTSRLIAWTFLSRERQNNWITTRWKEFFPKNC